MEKLANFIKHGVVPTESTSERICGIIIGEVSSNHIIQSITSLACLAIR